MSGESKFAIFRAGYSGYEPFGQIAQRVTLETAQADIATLKRRYPHQEFVIMGEVGTATKSERVTVKLTAPDLGANVVKLERAKESSR
jgi:hypothetical protein